MLWVGIDEAGYGPNLGPLVMSAVVAEGPADRPPDVWGDLPETISRAGGRGDRLWIDDSKRLYSGGRGLDRLEVATFAALDAAGSIVPGTLSGLLAMLGAGGFDEVELSPWLDPGADPTVPRAESSPLVERLQALRPFAGAPWRIARIRSVVVGPSRFNRDLEAGGNKATAHFATFAALLDWLWTGHDAGVDLSVRADKHGGRHFYLEPLSRAFPDAWIDRGPEGPALSRYLIRSGSKRLQLSLQPRADADDGLVALASIVSKLIRECWMAAFNAHWLARIPGLKPTAGYPVDAARFRSAIEPHCRTRGLVISDWWRAR